MEEGVAQALPPQPETERPEASGGLWLGLRPRAVALILLLQAGMIWWVVDSEMARGIYLICYSLMMPTVLYLLLSRIVRRWLPFDDKELMIAYVVLTVTIPIVGFGGLRFLAHGMGGFQHLAETQPQFVKFLPYMGSLPVLHDPDAIHALYSGGDFVPWGAWTIPIIYWSVYLLLLSAIWICLAGILKRVWINQERLTFPVAMLPLKMADPKEDIFRSPLFWLGFVLPVVLQSLLAFHNRWPSIPALQMKAFDIKPLIFTTPPWNAMPNLPVGFYPMALGLAYFVPSNVSFSCWFLGLAQKLSYVVAAIFGVEAAGTGACRFPYKDEQAAGSWIALAVIVLWGARKHWRNVAHLVPRKELSAVRFYAIMAGACALICAAMMSAVGIPGLVAVGAIFVYCAYVISGARIRAEAGAQWTFAPVVWTPHRVTDAAFGTNMLSHQSLAAVGHFDMVHVDIRAQSLPYLLEGMAIADRSGIKSRTLMSWVMIGMVTALAMGWYFSLTKLHALGAATAKNAIYPLYKVGISYGAVERISNAPAGVDAEGVAAMSVAALITVLLSWSRRLGPFGLHPIGYVMSNTLTMGAFLVPFFIAWLVKTTVLRLGGNAAYRRSVPFFVGVIVGDISIQAFWAAFGSIFDVPIYQFLT